MYWRVLLLWLVMVWVPAKAMVWAPVLASTQAQAQASASGPANATFPVLDISSTGSDRIELGPRMGVLVDPEGALTVEQVRAEKSLWQTITRRSPNFGFTKDAYWFRFTLRNTDARVLTRLIELPVAFIDDIQFFHYAGDALKVRYALGDEKPFKQRVIRHRDFIIPVDLAPGDNHIYMRMASAGTIEAALRIWDADHFQADSNDENLVQGSVIGIMLIMIIYNLFVYVSTKDINYLYYIGFVASYLLFHLTLNGYAFAYLWPESVRWNSFAISTFLAGGLIFTPLFANRFLRLKSFSLPAFQLLRVLTWAGMALLVLTFVLPYSLTIRLGAAMTIPTLISALVIGYWRWWRGATFARFYCLAWSAISIGMIILNAGKFGWIPINMWTENAAQAGIVLQVLLLSFTLADRINTDRALRLDAQAEALTHERAARSSQQSLIEVTEESNRELEQRVLGRTIELNAAMDQLKDANDQLVRLSTIDGLTQISNRACFDAAVDLEMRRAARHHSAITVIMLDIDHFKHVNDTYGHLAGDACLRAMADLLRPRIHRSGDIFARYGGEEFVIALGDVDLEHALGLAQEFRAAIEAMELEFDGQPIRLTASLGVVCEIPYPPLVAKDFLAAADKALYQAKHDGRNCVRVGTIAHPTTG